MSRPSAQSRDAARTVRALERRVFSRTRLSSPPPAVSARRRQDEGHSYWAKDGGGFMTAFHDGRARSPLDPKLLPVSTPGPGSGAAAQRPGSSSSTMQFSQSTLERGLSKGRGHSGGGSVSSSSLGSTRRTGGGGSRGGSSARRSKRGEHARARDRGVGFDDDFGRADTAASGLEQPSIDMETFTAASGTGTAGTNSSAYWSMSQGWNKRPQVRDHGILYGFERAGSRNGGTRSGTRRRANASARAARASATLRSAASTATASAGTMISSGKRSTPAAWTSSADGAIASSLEQHVPGPNYSLEQYCQAERRTSASKRVLGGGVSGEPRFTPGPSSFIPVHACHTPAPGQYSPIETLTASTRPCSAALVGGGRAVASGIFSASGRNISPGPIYDPTEASKQRSNMSTAPEPTMGIKLDHGSAIPNKPLYPEPAADPGE